MQSCRQDFVFHTIAAYLDRCGVASSPMRRFPSLTDENGLEAEQFTIRRVALTPEQQVIRGVAGSDAVVQRERELLSALPPFRLDLCPNGDEIGCY